MEMKEMKWNQKERERDEEKKAYRIEKEKKCMKFLTNNAY